MQSSSEKLTHVQLKQPPRPVTRVPHGELEQREKPVSPEKHTQPVSNGHGGDGASVSVAHVAALLRSRALVNACKAGDDPAKKFWQLMRDLRAVEKKLLGRELMMDELRIASDEWHQLSQPFLDKAKDDYFAEIVARLCKVRVATGEGDVLNKARVAVSKLSVSELPEIPGLPNAPKSWRIIVALHSELSRLCGGNTYFLSCRDAAATCPGLSPQTAHNIAGALARLGVIKIISKGKAGLNSEKAAEFRYLLPETDNTAEDKEDSGLDL
jgi:hypothetical protein